MMRDTETFFAALAEWAATRDDVAAVALVGSYARGTARPDSDVDVVILANDPRRYLDDSTWLEHFGKSGPPVREDYHMVTSLRTTYDDGLEVEFGLTVPERADTESLPTGTRRVVADGCRIIFDRHRILATLLQAVTETA